jgi:hypothetical protein
VVEQDAVKDLHPIPFAVATGDVEGVGLGATIRGPRVKGRLFSLRCLQNPPEHLRTAGLIDLRLRSVLPDSLDEPGEACPGDVDGGRWDVVGDSDVTHRSEVVDLIRPDCLDDSSEAPCVGHITIMELEPVLDVGDAV